MLLLYRTGPVTLAAVGLALLLSACEPDTQTESYVGTWDPLFLSPEGKAFPLDNAGISFRDGEICFLRFDEQCFDAVYTEIGDVISVDIGGEPNSYLLHMPAAGYLVVQQAGDRPIFHIRRQPD